MSIFRMFARRTWTPSSVKFAARCVASPAARTQAFRRKRCDYQARKMPQRPRRASHGCAPVAHSRIHPGGRHPALALKASIDAAGRQRPASCGKIRLWRFSAATAAPPAQPSMVEILAQCRPRVLLLRQAAALQLGDDELDEFTDVVHRRVAAAENE